jgi:hypothetical protein
VSLTWVPFIGFSCLALNRVKNIGRYLNKIKYLFYFFIPVLALTNILAAFLFGANLTNPINILLNFRLSNIYETINFYGFPLIGTESSVGTINSLNGVVVDNGYLMLLLQKGAIIGIIVLLAWYG